MSANLLWTVASLTCALALSFAGAVHGAASGPDIRLDLKPKICTLSGAEKQCETSVRAAWRSPRRESLCLVIVDRPDIKQCWENFSRGTYSVELVFSDDLVLELRDPQLQTVLTSKVLKVIREALDYRRKRRQPWNIMY